jgi:tRNA(Ile)-lysidine synthase
VSTADEPIGDDELGALFHGLEGLPGFVLAVSGGPDSTALLVLAARWAKRLKGKAPKLLAATVDHGLRRQAAAEAASVRGLARRLSVAHQTLRWCGKKPESGLQEAARAARYGLLAQAAGRAGYAHILTAHTLDDQAETVLFRLARGSGLAGLSGMASPTPLPTAEGQEMVLVRPFLNIAKSRLVATLRAAAIAYSEDPSNSDPRFTRARLRGLIPALAREGLDARALSRLAMRMRRADCAIEFAVAAAQAALAPAPWSQRGPVAFEFGGFADLPAEVGLRLLGRAIAHTGNEGPVELGKLEALYEAVRTAAPHRVRRTLAGALVTLAGGRLTVERAPARRTAAMPQNRKSRFAK